MLETIREYLEDRRHEAAKTLLEQHEPWEIAELLSDPELSDTDQGVLFRLLSKDVAIEVFESLTGEQQVELIEGLSRSESVSILEELDPDDRARLLDEMPAKVAKRLIGALAPGSREVVTRLLNFPEGAVGRIISPNYVAVRDTGTAADATSAVRRSQLDHEHLTTVFVVDATRRYRGLVHLAELVKAAPETPITELVEDADIRVYGTDPQDEAVRLLQRRDLASLPVVDREERLVGAVTVDDAMDIVERETSESEYRMAGIGDPVVSTDAVRSQRLTGGSILYPVRVRMGFLAITLVGGVLVGGLIDQFESTLEAVTALAIFIPMIMDMGGNVGTQSTTIFARALALGHIEEGRIVRHIFREMRVGATIGLLLGTAAGLVAWVWQGMPNNVPELGLAVGIALFVTITLASFLGFFLPWLLVKLGLDHAPGSNPLLTTIKDFTGLFVYFSLATWILDLT